ncbi:MAG TPA: hypothetical protein VD741_06640 [Solirubrobacterales bacterium]|nr:hypothetical protein [Solirubrobacterales bacterium]
MSGVITRWSIHDATGADPGELPQALQVYRKGPGPNAFTLVNQTAQTPLVPGFNSVPARLPVQAGDRLGIYSSVAAMYCEGEDGDLIGYNEEGPLKVGDTRTFDEDAPYRIPVRATIEPDADNDGFGDETQDGCPQSAAVQAACPPVPVALAFATGKQIRKGSVTIAVTPSTAAPVSVLGVVKLGKGKKATLNGGTQNLTPGVPGKFTLKFTKKVKKKLKELPPKRSLQLNVTVSGASTSGVVTTKTLKLKLRGQAKPSKRSKP